MKMLHFLKFNYYCYSPLVFKFYFDFNFGHELNISNDMAILIFILNDSDFSREPNAS